MLEITYLPTQELYIKKFENLEEAKGDVICRCTISSIQRILVTGNDLDLILEMCTNLRTVRNSNTCVFIGDDARFIFANIISSGPSS